MNEENVQLHNLKNKERKTKKGEKEKENPRKWKRVQNTYKTEDQSQR